MPTTRGLGRGLGSLIPQQIVKEVHSPAAGVPLIVPLEHVVPNPFQPRQDFSHTDLEELISSIKIHGILQPLVVTEKTNGIYELIAGERRLRAARMAGLSGVPVIVRTAADQDKLELALIENIQRQDLNPIEEARAYRRLLDEHSLRQEDVALRVGKSRSQIANTVRLLELPIAIQDAVRSGSLSATAARTLLSFDTPDEQMQWWQRMSKEKMSVHEIEEAVHRTQGKRRVTIPNANIEADEAVLRGVLGTKVSIKKRGDSGTIVISFFSPEEYRAIVDKITSFFRSKAP